MHLRKTALGASSPAKPALHMPDLDLGQLHGTKVEGYENAPQALDASSFEHPSVSALPVKRTHCR